MKSTGPEFDQEIISKEKIRVLNRNSDVVRDINPICESLKEENLKIRSYYSVYSLQLENLSKGLQEIQERSKVLQVELRNQTAVFEALRQVLVDSEIKEEHLNALEEPVFGTPEGLAKIEQAFAVFEESQECAFDIRVVKSRQSGIENGIKLFFKKFCSFFEDLMASFEATSDGKLRVHTGIYEDIKKFDFVFKFAFRNRRESFVSVSSLYSKYSKAIYYKEFEKHLNIIQKLLSGKDQEKFCQGMDIFIESFFMILKCEVHFCRTRLFFGDDVTEFVSGMFKEVFGLVLNTFHSLFKLKSLSLICSLNRDFVFEFQNEERNIWLVFIDKIKKLREEMKKVFLLKERDGLRGRSRTRNLDRCLEQIRVCNDLYITERLLEMTAQDISGRDKENVEDTVHTLKLLYKMSRDIQTRPELVATSKEVENVISERLKDLERQSIGYVFGGDNSKVAKRTKGILKLIDNDPDILAFFKSVIFENVDDEQKREIQILF